MAAADVRDMLDLPAEGQPRPHKKQKVVEKRPGWFGSVLDIQKYMDANNHDATEGITRELYALLGERAPPIAINENRYKGRPKWMNKLRVRPWQIAPFTNDARSDGLVLRHWQRRPEATTAQAPEGPSEMEVDGAKVEDGAVKPADQTYSFAKYNVKAQVPRRYTDEEYNRHLKNDDWSRQETDYLMDLVEEYDLRWVVIADRYDFHPQPADSESNATALVPAKRYRTMEQMKARYYFIAASMLALEHPPSEMSEAEFDLHEKMMKFDPDRERARKELAALQLNRSADEVREEGILLEELKRITSNEQNFITERRELYSRLEVPVSVGNTTMYQSSQGLSQLLQTLLQADKSKKRRSILGPEGAAPSPAGQTPTSNAPTSARDSRADTPSNAAAAPTNKKASNAAAAAAAAAASTAASSAAAAKEPQHTVKTLTAAEEARYGVQHHDRLAPGVQFRSDRAQKLTQAKSNVQSQKLAAALAELEIPPRLVMPTERVCKEFERLIHSVNLLLDARKVSEKVESEIRVLESAREERERKTKESKEKEKPEVKAEESEETAGGENAHAASSMGSIKTSGSGDEKTGPAAETGQQGADADAGDPEHEGAPHKRSASVLSNGSDKSTKRQKK
ncbi:SANT/Myb-like DNA-binding domain-containing protein [Aspergillus clavatus NRRL 1]|uniref:SWR1-complex protein 4 n=1 Tax=Aspergillus clavatus (strain ATCC 1007 / CBS 513.65 / DSM 816 / NCTC 3887 / NRRL 1 / QM 1276 / 107) TaxID=344612 RepID=A1CH49_ASPCL|nr:DNA methyltransferase 1-associated protein DMAP1 [Aspergillus clavatus NRRL 1]EAW10204.1 DNA methyltransferase 1-associated protein DMAP1 [Aspergillus clavatus NRRL 1]